MSIELIHQNAEILWEKSDSYEWSRKLNAIAKTRLFAVLMMDLLLASPRNEYEFKDRDEFEIEHEYYQQVIGKRAPHLTSDRLLAAIGVGHRSAFTRKRRILQLPHAAWEFADEHDISESNILKACRIKNENDMLAFMRKLVEDAVPENA